MKRNLITIHNSVFISKPRGVVWDFTQNYDYRHKWDSTVLNAKVIQSAPRTVRLKMTGRTEMTFVYKLDERPHKTTLAAKDVSSSFIETAGGSWLYEEKDNGTQWTLTNTVVLKENALLTLLLPLYSWAFKQQVKKAMKKAKLLIEAG